MTDTDPRDDVPDSAAERAGIVDQQDAALAAIQNEDRAEGGDDLDEDVDDDPVQGEAPTS
jgi:hypothetical protein